MIEVFDTAAARIALARRKLGCPDCGQPLRPWGHARERTIRDLGGTLMAVRPDRARCTGCGATHVVLDAGLLPRRAYAAGLVGQALVAAALGHGHRRIASGLAVPAGTVRSWIRGARRSAVQLRITGIRTVVAFDQDALPARVRPDELGCALEHLGAAALVIGRRFGLQHTSPWARINVLTRGRLLAMAPAG
jgi:transposase-like protein